MKINVDPTRNARKIRFHGKVFKIKPENQSKAKKAQKKSKKYYKWMVEEKPRSRNRFPQLNKHLKRGTRSEFQILAASIEETPSKELFSVNRRAIG